jgi:hypothetical protein
VSCALRVRPREQLHHAGASQGHVFVGKVQANVLGADGRLA